MGGNKKQSPVSFWCSGNWHSSDGTQDSSWILILETETEGGNGDSSSFTNFLHSVNEVVESEAMCIMIGHVNIKKYS